jgi:hypothetical protein
VKDPLFLSRSLTFVYKLKDAETKMDADTVTTDDQRCDNNHNNDNCVHGWTSWEHPGPDSTATVSKGKKKEKYQSLKGCRLRYIMALYKISSPLTALRNNKRYLDL